jgi:hypothetical protein
MTAIGMIRANPFALAAGVLDDVGIAISRIDDSAGRIQQLIASHGDGLLDDAAKASTRDARIGAAKLNLEAQERLQPHLDSGLDVTVSSRLRNADASLEDAAWQLASKPSPDGRFSGTDLPGALRDSRAAVAILRELLPL